jgi:hypothetical protein
MRKPRKLTLSRETIRHIQPAELRVLGASDTCGYCPSYTPDTCGVCSGHCGTGPYNRSNTDCSDVCIVYNGCATEGNTQCC